MESWNMGHRRNLMILAVIWICIQIQKYFDIISITVGTIILHMAGLRSMNSTYTRDCWKLSASGCKLQDTHEHPCWRSVLSKCFYSSL